MSWISLAQQKLFYCAPIAQKNVKNVCAVAEIALIEILLRNRAVNSRLSIAHLLRKNAQLGGFLCGESDRAVLRK